MDASLILRTSSIRFMITALGGLTMAAIRLGRKCNPPAWLAMLHGFLAAAGLKLLACACFPVARSPLASLALLLFLVAALGGVGMTSTISSRERLCRSG